MYRLLAHHGTSRLMRYWLSTRTAVGSGRVRKLLVSEDMGMSALSLLSLQLYHLMEEVAVSSASIRVAAAALGGNKAPGYCYDRERGRSSGGRGRPGAAVSGSGRSAVCESMTHMFVTAGDIQQQLAPIRYPSHQSLALPAPFTECPSPPPGPLLSSSPGPGSSSNPHQIAPLSSSTLPQRQALGHPPLRLRLRLC